MQNIARLALLGTHLGCGYSEADYADDRAIALCDKMFECTAEATRDPLYASVEDCYADAEETGETCDFDNEQARTCVDDLTAMSCESYNAGAFPETCATVCG